MVLDNKLNITDQVELSRKEELISKTRAKQLFDTGEINKIEVGTFKGLALIHKYLFDDIYDFAGQIRNVNIAKGNFQFVPRIYLEPALEAIDKLPQGDFNEIVEKYVEMNVAHPFREGNGRSTRIWLDLVFKKELGKVVDWQKVDKEDYLLAMERSPIKDTEIKVLLNNAMTTEINDRQIYMKGIDASYFYEGYFEYPTESLKSIENKFDERLAKTEWQKDSQVKDQEPFIENDLKARK